MFIYSFFIQLYVFLIRVVALWNQKAALWVNGRKGWQIRLKKAMSESGDKKVIWIHCASLGEFEQGRPLMESLKKDFPSSFIILTFFSPSGYEIRKNYAIADWVMYLPADTRRNAETFLELTKPDLAIFVKYEYWFNLILGLKKRNIPTLMVSGIFFKNQIFFKWYGKWGQQFLNVFKMIFVQNKASADLLKKIGMNHVVIAGDTRFDRVLSIAHEFTHIELIRKFCEGRFTYVLGSTWEEDEALWQEWIASHQTDIFIIAPHEIDEEHIHGIEQRWAGCIRFSQLKDVHIFQSKHILIIDNIGMLSSIYQYANISYVGGGFGNGIHNTLEAAVYGKPVLFGPEHEIFTEALGLIEAKSGFVIHDPKELEACLNDLTKNEEKLKQSSAAAAHFVKTHAGATDKILKYIQENLLLSN